jgi:hypothetical protein
MLDRGLALVEVQCGRKQDHKCVGQQRRAQCRNIAKQDLRLVDCLL